MHKLRNAEQLARSLEKYLLSDKQDKSLLNDLIPGSKEDIYFRCIEALHSEVPYSDLDDELKQILEPSPSSTSNYQPQGLRKRLFLRKFDETQDFTAINSQLGLYPDSASAPAFLSEMGIKGLGEGPKDPSVFSPEINFDLEEGLKDRQISQIHPLFRHKIDFTKGQAYGWQMTQVDLIDFENESLYKTIKRIIKDEGPQSINYKAFNISQLKRLLAQNKVLKGNQEVFGLLFTHTFEEKGAIPAIEQGNFAPSKLIPILKEMLDFVSEYPIGVTQQLKSVLLYELLHLGVQCDLVEFPILLKYLKNPLKYKHSDTLVSKKFVNQSSGSSSIQAALKAVKSPHQINDTQLIKAYIEYFLKHPEEIKPDVEEEKQPEEKKQADSKLRPKVLDDSDQEIEDIGEHFEQEQLEIQPDYEQMQLEEEIQDEDDQEDDQVVSDRESEDKSEESKSDKSQQEEGPLGSLTKFFRKEFLEQTIKEMRFMDGVKVEMKEGEYSHFERLGRKIVLEFVASNQQRFKPEQVVRMKLKVKNVPQLLVRVFEINTQNYYREKNEPFQSDINLQGLVPAQERVYNFDHAPHLLHSQQFEIQELTGKVGLFVVEFIGNGMSSRAIVKKGSLNLVSIATLAGHLVYIVNENHQICRSHHETGMFFDNKFFKADPSTGRIIVPYSATSLEAKAVISHRGFSSICQFERLEEKYELKAAFIVHEEAFMIGNKAKILIRPELSLHGKQAPLNLLKKINVAVELHTGGESEGVNTTKFQNLELKDDQLIIQIQIPAKLHNLAIQLQAQVSGKDKSHKVEAGFLRNIELFQSSFHYIEGYLRLTQDENYELLVLGKNGEPVKNQKLEIKWKHRHYSQTQWGRYQTDGAGIVKMGPLTNLEWIELSISGAGGRDSVSRKWHLPDMLKFQRQKSLQILRNEECQIPVQTKEYSDKLFSLTRMNSKHEPLRDCTSKIEFKKGNNLSYLKIKDLTKGTYLLHIKEEQVKIRINVIDGKVWEDQQFITTESGILERAMTSETLIISEIEVGENEVRCKVDNASDKTSVHLIGFSYIPQNLMKFFEAFRDTPADLEEFPFSKWSNFYLGQKMLSNEFRYVLERNRLPNGTGNMLEKPTLLLKRQEI